MPEEELDLIQFAAGEVAQAGARGPEIVLYPSPFRSTRAHPACSFDRGTRRRDDPRRRCRQSASCVGAIRALRGAIRAVPAGERAA